MNLYIGGSKVKIIINDKSFRLMTITTSSTPTINDVRLMSSDNYILQDSNGLYLFAKEDK